MKKKQNPIVRIDIAGFKKAIKSELDKGYIDNLSYIECLAWIKELEKKIHEKEKEA